MNNINKTARTGVIKNRQIILRGAREIFARKGMAVEMLEIAALAGVAVGTIYRHFENREGLVNALISECITAMHKELIPLTEREDSIAAFREVLRVAASWCEHYGKFAEEVIRGKLGNQETITWEINGPLISILERGVEQGAFRKDLDIPIIVMLTGSLFHWRNIFDIAKRRSFLEVADSIADFMLIGMIDRP